MDCCQIAAVVNAIACIISKEVPDTNNLTLLATIFAQLGDTLATIAACKSNCNNQNNNCDNNIK